MLAIVRVKTRRGNDVLWDYVLDNKKELEKGMMDQAKLLYMTKRDKHKDTSLFISAKNPDALGKFVMERIAPIQDVDGLWIINPLAMKFFKLPESLLLEWQRFVVTLKAYPNKFTEIYNTVLKLSPTSDTAPVYLANTFHLYGDSIQFSLVAKDLTCAQKFVEENIDDTPGVLGTTMTAIKKQQRLASREEWKEYINANLVTSL